MKADYFDIFLKVLTILGIILIVYWFIQLMLGGSPSLSQFNAGLIFVLVSLVVNLYYKSGKFSQFIEGTFPRFEKSMENSFNRVKEDMKEIKMGVGLIKKKLKI